MKSMFPKKILCLGNNSDDTDFLVSQLAKENSTENYGLITHEDFIPAENGYYHSTVVDLPIGSIVTLAKNFDSVKMLDQPAASWSHWKVLSSTYKALQHLELHGINVEYRSNKNVQKMFEFDELLKTNKSFCIYPWILKIEHGGITTACARSSGQITTTDSIKNWATDPSYTAIRQKMLAGVQVPEICDICYKQEAIGVESYRVFETKEWINKLGITSINDLNKIDSPRYYEVRLSNKCNIACRGCRPSYSSTIELEYKKYNIIHPEKERWEYSTLDIIDRHLLDSSVRVHLTGGEPLVMREVYKFMRECIDLGKTDFDFTLGTNATIVSDKFLLLSEKFSNLNFSVSLDGYGKINDYWRWGTDWDTVINNIKKLQAQGHTISINCIPGIYNVTNLHLLMEFMDRELPFAGFYLQLNYNRIHSAFQHPNAKLVVESMSKCQHTNAYYIDGKSVRSVIDTLYNHYSNNPKFDPAALRDFFVYNDQQDNARNVKLVDYIPELDACRSLI